MKCLSSTLQYCLHGAVFSSCVVSLFRQSRQYMWQFSGRNKKSTKLCYCWQKPFICYRIKFYLWRRVSLITTTHFWIYRMTNLIIHNQEKCFSVCFARRKTFVYLKNLFFEVLSTWKAKIVDVHGNFGVYATPQMIMYLNQNEQLFPKIFLMQKCWKFVVQSFILSLW